MSEQLPSIGRIVHYRLSADDSTQINRRRTTGASIAARMKDAVSMHESITAWPAGAQAHIGNEAHEGDVFWAMSRCVGDQPGTFSWPVRL